jgi:hypothetical protein
MIRITLALLVVIGAADMAMSETSRSIALQELLNGGIVNNIEMANKMAELVISRLWSSRAGAPKAA